MEVVEQFAEHLKNRDRHFADTGAFRRAVARAKEVGCPLVVGDLLEMLSRTHPRLIPDCIATLSSSEVVILNAKTGLELDARTLAKIAAFATVVATKRRPPRLTREPKGAGPGSANQVLATQGSITAADKRARRMAPQVEQIRAAIGGQLTPTALARELNARGALTDRGNPWSATTARDLIKRLERIRSDRLDPEPGS